MTRDEDHKRIMADLGRVAHERFAGEELESFLTFLDCFYPPQSPDDLLDQPVETLFSIAAAMWRAAAERVVGTPSLTILNPRGQEEGWSSRNTILMIVNNDMPFLVDSLTGALSLTLRQRLHMMHHPILPVVRDADGRRLPEETDEALSLRESYIYIEIDPQSDEEMLDHIRQTLLSVLSDVSAVVKDWKAMLAKIDETVASLTVNPPPVDQNEVDETIRFLRWLGDDHFTFLGFREYRFDVAAENFDFGRVERSGLGILRDTERYVLRDKDGLTPMSREIRHFLTQPEPLIITKANVKSSVHRVSHMDYVGVKIFDENGVAVGERRFVGLFTSLAYSQFAHDVPLLRHKVARIQERALFEKRSHAGKALSHVLETFPRDELFQISEALLYETAMGILQLIERPRPRAFVRRDEFERFVSALVYVPRENYHTGLRARVEQILCNAFNGEVSVYYAMLSDASLARWHFIIRTKPGAVPSVDEKDVNAQIAEAAQGWNDRLQLALTERGGEERGNKLFHIYKDRFSIAYREAFSPKQAAYDIDKLETISGKDEVGVDFYRHLDDGDGRYRLKLHHGQRMVPLSACMPILENMGFRALVQHSYQMVGSGQGHIHDFMLECARVCSLSLDELKPLVEALFLRVMSGVIENDRFNELTTLASIPWDRILVFRAYGKYLRQLGLGYTPTYMARCLGAHPDFAMKLWDLFQAQFDPDSVDEDRAEALAADIRVSLEAVSSLDEDRILRGYLNAIRATLRTNFYQTGVVEGKKPHALAFKIRSRDVEEAPLPRPYAEIWVYSPRVEGVHLRGGPIARGGLRWSDRREDFRTEILGLVKAQQVKNAVIVPQGAKGGFFAKRLPSPSKRKAFQDEGVAAYKTFIASLLSLTDNLKQDKVKPPLNVVRRDGDDPYLVVAADKGTATFSDTANALSQKAGFWLDDAFASGGSKGYDHKKMGITARGAWVSVQRHFREMGGNVQNDPIDVIGVGDMSGDVFGNGMLLSKTIRLKAAFNHVHIFIDPDPQNAAAQWDERKRLFETPGSTWQDYDAALISKGGGVFSRTDKFIALSPEIRAWLHVEDAQLTPSALVHAILKAKADLLWFGGIGTYVRAEEESNAQVGDRANDALRITADELQVKAVGEGGNLGMTQRARIAFARRGGRVNTDFIDNSAGVDCSDKEVNIKILLSLAENRGKLTRDERDVLLEEMTDEVSDIVLSDNYLQTQAISLAQDGAVSEREYHLGLIRALERDSDLDREIEVLPSDEGFAELAAGDAGLSRPELSTLLAYAKMSLTSVLTRSKLIDNPVLRPELEWGFPSVLRERFPDEIADHRLRREIIATVLANAVINWGGLSFVYEIREETGLGVEDIVAAFVTVREAFEMTPRWEAINALDYDVPSAIQHDMHRSLSESLKAQVRWMLRSLPRPLDISALVERYRLAVRALFDIDVKVLSDPAREAFEERREIYKTTGVPHDLATYVAGLELFRSASDIIVVAEKTGRSVGDVATVHFALADLLGFDWLRQRADRIILDDHWDRLSIRADLEDLEDQQRILVEAVCTAAGKDTDVSKAVKAWAKKEKTRVIRAKRLIDDLTASGSLTPPKLSFANRRLRSILR
ncbi:NAD-glutamate dehydrogenase [Eilatimonas milleporae]|uniref:Glutamate dehydrogenase n=1 Tax=Eilatimonas milleporae TaxID=911205 RepID=A0A3M0CYH9_9PROT|nr:NAD-glutamate dehydrogenase [Eilatimonas milleporae]RMB12686.1 glutamate dehydrogenase [Eilatimonas milleporae]